jgi:hypothetical protein
MYDSQSKWQQANTSFHPTENGNKDAKNLLTEKEATLKDAKSTIITVKEKSSTNMSKLS